jgi:hypothetical protein
MEESPDIGLLGRGWLSPNGLRGLAGRGKLWAVGLNAVAEEDRLYFGFFCLFGLHAIKTESELENRIDTICGPNPKTEKPTNSVYSGSGPVRVRLTGLKCPALSVRN